MKVALIVEWLDPWRGGAETSTLQFVHRLLDRGVDLHVFTRSRLSPAPGIRIRTFSGTSLSRTKQTVTFSHRVRQALRAESFDVVHAVTPCRGADLYQPRGGTIAETIERNLALLRNGSARSLRGLLNRVNLKRQYLLRFERRWLSAADGPVVVAISQYVRDQLIRHYGLPDERIRLIYNGVDPDPTPEAQRAANRRTLRRDYGVADGDCLVLMVAHNFRLKGLQRWMEALQRLKHRGVNDVRSLIVGKGESQAWHRRAERLGINDRLAFVGSTDRVHAYRHAADVLVHPTYYDPCSRVVLEGMCAGLPCITTRWDGAAERIDHGRNGFVLQDPWDVDALADCVDRFRDPQLRAEVSTRARTIADRVSMARNADEMIRLYETIAAGKVAT